MVNRENRRLQPADEAFYQQAMERIAQNRDRGAFALLFDRFAPRLKTFMMRKGVATEQAEDLVQETMIAVWTKAGLYNPARGSVSAWIFTIARNLRIDRIRRESSMSYAVLEDFDQPSDEEAIDDVLAGREEQSAVARALSEIPPEQRDVLILSYVEDIPQSEIARRLSLPLGTVKSRMRLAYNRMRKSLENLT
jgi:RNA polymerase sigma-70 factor (ECF subfamily)